MFSTGFYIGHQVASPLHFMSKTLTQGEENNQKEEPEMRLYVKTKPQWEKVNHGEKSEGKKEVKGLTIRRSESVTEERVLLFG